MISVYIGKVLISLGVDKFYMILYQYFQLDMQDLGFFVVLGEWVKFSTYLISI